MTDKTSTKSPRLAFFDGYRGVLILLILTYYFFQHILPGGFLSSSLGRLLPPKDGLSSAMWLAAPRPFLSLGAKSPHILPRFFSATLL